MILKYYEFCLMNFVNKMINSGKYFALPFTEHFSLVLQKTGISIQTGLSYNRNVLAQVTFIVQGFGNGLN